MTDDQKARMTKKEGAGQKYAKWNLEGYQADFDFNNHYTGQLYEQGTGRGIIAWRGQVVATEAGKKPRLLSTLGTSDDLKAFIKPGEWNQYEIIADATPSSTLSTDTSWPFWWTPIPSTRKRKASLPSRLKVAVISKSLTAMSG